MPAGTAKTAKHKGALACRPPPPSRSAGGKTIDGLSPQHTDDDPGASVELDAANFAERVGHVAHHEEEIFRGAEAVINQSVRHNLDLGRRDSTSTGKEDVAIIVIKRAPSVEELLELQPLHRTLLLGLRVAVRPDLVHVGAVRA